MRYFIHFWVVIAIFIIFAGGLEAADVVATSQKVAIINPILPIEPNASAPRATIWQKTKQQLRLLRKKGAKPNEVEPIAPFMYKLIGGVTILEMIPYGIITGIALISGLLELGVTAAIWPLLFGLLGLVGLVFIIFYAIKLFGAASGKDRFMKGKRFRIGYIATIAIFVIWAIAITAVMYGLRAWGSPAVLTGGMVASGLIIGLIFCLPLLIFNISDHLHYKRYLKEQAQK